MYICMAHHGPAEFKGHLWVEISLTDRVIIMRLHIYRSRIKENKSDKKKHKVCDLLLKAVVERKNTHLKRSSKRTFLKKQVQNKARIKVRKIFLLPKLCVLLQMLRQTLTVDGRKRN